MGWSDSAQEELECSPLYIKLVKAFRVFDKNGDGFIDAAELRDLLLRVNPDADPTKGDGLTEDDCATIIASFDDNGDGKLAIEELCAAWSVIGGTDAKLKEAMVEKRAAAKEALKRKQAAAATMKAKGGSSEPAKADDFEPTQALAPMVGGASGFKTGGSSAAEASKEAPKEAPKAETAAERARAAATAKVGKAVTEGAGSLSSVKQVEKEKDPAEMTMQERAKAKADVAEKARKKALREAAEAEAEAKALAVA